MENRYISYLRVSTSRQGHSGLGLEAQRQQVQAYVDRNGGDLIEEFVEIESGKVNDRPGLAQAIAECRRQGATLLIAKLDRLARSVAFISSLMEAGTDFVAVDMPSANKLMLHLMAAFAEHERTEISNRTKAALAAAKARGVVLGRNGRILADQHRTGAQVFAESIRPVIDRFQREGARTYRDLADRLNEAGIRSRENAVWSPGMTFRLMARLSPTATKTCTVMS